MLIRRKSPRQSRAIATVDAIVEAAVQLLITNGPQRINTTRVAERAGVSVGTLYQYFSNKQALLFTVLEHHTGLLAQAVEDECLQDIGSDTAERLVGAYVRAKLAQAKISPVLYKIAMDLDAYDLAEAASRRSAGAIEAALRRTGQYSDPALLSLTVSAALYGMLPAFCSRVLAVSDGLAAERQLVIMVNSCLAADGAIV